MGFVAFTLKRQGHRIRFWASGSAEIDSKG